MAEENGRKASFHDNYQEKTDLSGLKFKRILMDSAEKKQIFVEAEVEHSSDPAVVILDKLPFTEAAVEGMLSASTGIENEMQNDIYGQYRLKPAPQHNLVKANIIHPATQKHLDKYITSPAHIVRESPELYHGLTLPYIQSEQFSLDWVYGILEHKKEVERIIYENPDPNTGFIIAPDFKWTGKQVEDLYCLAIVHKRGIKSLRDLNQSHLPLLYNLLNEGRRAIRDKYGLAESKIRAYFHYQPSYYHLHVHFNNVEYTPPGVNCEKSHMLETVISNVERHGNYYREATLDFVVREKDKLYKAYSQAGHFNTKVSSPSEDDILTREFEEGDDCSKVLEFLEMIGKAKHEPSGEYWDSSYGESSWRMAVLSLCAPPSINRQKLVDLSLVASFSSLGRSNDENTEWETKIREVCAILRKHLPIQVAGRLSALFTEHAEIRRGRLDGTAEHTIYRGILELEETILRWEEDGKGRSEPLTTEPIIQKMAKLHFPGSLSYQQFKDKSLLEKTLKFIFDISRLMRLQRTGWVKCKVRAPETVAAHMYRMGLLGLLFSHQQKSDGLRLVADACIIGICHDMAECIIGDITPHCKVSPEDKQREEMLAFTQLVEHLPESLATDLLIPFRRYEEQKPGDFNAILTKDYDKFDMILQAFEYEKKEKRGRFLQQFFDSTKDVFNTRAVKKWQTALLQTREDHFMQQ